LIGIDMFGIYAALQRAARLTLGNDLFRY